MLVYRSVDVVCKETKKYPICRGMDFEHLSSIKLEGHYIDTKTIHWEIPPMGKIYHTITIHLSFPELVDDGESEWWMTFLSEAFFKVDST